jgi:Domain of unknown function (DUF4062)
MSTETIQMTVERRLQVFVSSTYTDMKDERKAAVEAILEAGDIPAGMELFTAGDITQWKLIQRWIKESDVYLLLVGGRYGTILPRSKKSYTEMEFEFAKKLKKPIFSLVGSEEFIRSKQKRRLLGKAADAKKARRLRTLASKRSVTYFSNRDQIKTQVTQALGPFRSQPGISGWVKAPVDAGPALLFPGAWRVGHGYLPDVEKSHSVAAITGMLWDKPKSILRLGSPYLRYWIESSEDPRLRWLMEHTKHIRVQVALFEVNGRRPRNYEQNRSVIAQQCRAIARAFPARLEFKMSKRASDLSYIIYPLQESNGATSRAMIGIQTQIYNERPFMELVFTSESPPPLALAAAALHEESFHA